VKQFSVDVIDSLLWQYTALSAWYSIKQDNLINGDHPKQDYERDKDLSHREGFRVKNNVTDSVRTP